MSEKRLKNKLLKKRLFTKNRLIILNEDTFEEIFSLKLTLMNVFVVATIGAILIITVTTFIIAFTPLREYIPGYTSSKLKKNVTELALKSDSLAFAIKKNEVYLESIKKVLNGDLEYAKVNKDSILAISVDKLPDLQLTATEAELKLRKEVADKELKIKKNQEKKIKKRK
ncbi:MAG: peptidase [Flavobacterium sp.]|nr:peptidase [Flavobacterium sp.]